MLERTAVPVDWAVGFALGIMTGAMLADAQLEGSPPLALVVSAVVLAVLLIAAAVGYRLYFRNRDATETVITDAPSFLAITLIVVSAVTCVYVFLCFVGVGDSRPILWGLCAATLALVILIAGLDIARAGRSRASASAPSETATPSS
jgi:hypothetical protein